MDKKKIIVSYIKQFQGIIIRIVDKINDDDLEIYMINDFLIRK